MLSELWLSVDLSARRGSLALHRFDGKCPSLVSEAELAHDFSHSEKLIPTLDALFAGAGVGLSDVGRFVTTSGPGSFTGLRIAYASLKGLALAVGKPIETVSGSEARGHAFAASRSDLAAGDRLIVATAVTRDRLARAVLVHDGKKACLAEETVVAASDLVPKGPGRSFVLLDEKAAHPSGIRFPLVARQLAECLPWASTRETHGDPASLIAASPRYFGETRYRTTF